MNANFDCGGFSGTTWSFSTEVDRALHSLPSLSRREREDKLTAKIKLIDDYSGWEWYLCEFSPTSKRAKGLVKGFAIESGAICMSSMGAKKQAKLILVFDFKPELLSEIRKKLTTKMIQTSSEKDNTPFKYDVFVSYASEDESFASRIVGGLQSHGIRSWYAPLVLKVGDSLRKSIEDGLRQSYAGIVIVSPQYIAKHWTEYEFDTLIRQYIERGKKILPVWHGVTYTDVDGFSTGLSGIKSLNSTSDLQHIVDNLVYSVADSAPTKGVVPSWEDIVYRFLNGRAELLTPDDNGVAFTVWEAALHFPESKYPMWVEGKLISQQEIFYNLANVLAYNPRVIQATEDQLKELKRLCKEWGYNPEGLL